jgi:hypothetical protein
VRRFNILFALIIVGIAWMGAWFFVNPVEEEDNRPRNSSSVSTEHSAGNSAPVEDIGKPTSEPEDQKKGRPTEVVEVPYVPPDEPVTTGQICTEYFDEPTTVTFQMIDRESDQPILAHTSLLLFDMEYLEFLHSVDDDWNFVAPRRAQPDKNGYVQVAFERYVDSEPPKDCTIEIPVPDSFQIDSNLADIAPSVMNDDVVKLYFRARPTLTVTVVDSKGKPVPDTIVYAMPLAVVEKDLIWARSSSLFEEDDWEQVGDNFTIDEEYAEYFIDEFKDWMTNPAQTLNPTRRFQTEYNGHNRRTNMHEASTDSEGKCQLPEMTAGKWLIVGFGWDGKDVKETVDLGNEAHEIRLAMEAVAVGKVVVDIIWKPLDPEYWVDEACYFEIGQIGQDPRMFDHVENFDGELDVKDGKARLEFSTPKSSLWRINLDGDGTTTVQSVPGKTSRFTWTIVPDQEDGTWKPTFKFGDGTWGSRVAVYADGKLNDHAYPDDEIYLRAGSYMAELPDGRFHEFTITPDQTLEEVIEIPSAKIQITLDEFMVKEFDTDEYDIEWMNHDRWDIYPEVKAAGSGHTITATIPTGYLEFQFEGCFEGTVNTKAGDVANFLYSKAKCTGYSRLMVVDNTTDGDACDGLQDTGRDDSYTNISEGSFSGPVLYLPGGFSMFEFSEARVHYYFGPAGPNLLDTDGRSIPVNLPGEVILTDFLLYEDEGQKRTRVQFESDDDWSYSGQAVHVDGSTHPFDYDAMLPLGAYAVHLWRFGEDEDGNKTAQYAEYSLHVGTKELTLRPLDFSWKDCVEVELEFHGLGTVESGEEASWWRDEVDVLIEQPHIKCKHEVRLDRIKSYAPPIRLGRIQLAPGNYIIRAQSGSTPVVINRFTVTLNGPKKFIIKDKP